MRFSLIDRITELETGKKLTAVKNLSLAEEYLADHFPGFPVMPGVLMMECLVQAGAWLMRDVDQFAYSTILLKQAKALKFVSFLRPGRTMNVSVEVHSWDGDQCTFKGSGSVDGETTVSGRLTLERFNLADKNPSLKASDELRIQEAKDLFAQLWTPGSR